MTFSQKAEEIKLVKKLARWKRVEVTQDEALTLVEDKWVNGGGDEIEKIAGQYYVSVKTHPIASHMGLPSLKEAKEFVKNLNDSPAVDDTATLEGES